MPKSVLFSVPVERRDRASGRFSALLRAGLQTLRLANRADTQSEFCEFFVRHTLSDIFIRYRYLFCMTKSKYIGFCLSSFEFFEGRYLQILCLCSMLLNFCYPTMFCGFKQKGKLLESGAVRGAGQGLHDRRSRPAEWPCRGA